MKDELLIAKKLIDTNVRLALVILDNLVELYIVKTIQDNAMMDYNLDKTNAKQRLELYSHFEEKLKYATKKNYISQEINDLFKILHRVRNSQYHTNDRINVAKPLANYYYEFVFKLINLDLDKTKLNYQTTNELGSFLKEDLNHRFKNFRTNLSISCMSDSNFDLTSITDEEINDVIDHIFSNYGEQSIEKSKFKKELKALYIQEFIEHQSSTNYFFKIEKLYEFEKVTNKHKWNNDLKSLKLWVEIDEEFKIYEEIVEVYVYIAC
jgi:predicted nucleic acid-binding protein